MKTRLENIAVKHYIPNGSEEGQEVLCIHDSHELALKAIADGGQSEDDDMMSTTCWHRAAEKSDVERLKYDGNGDAVVLVDAYTDFDSFREAVENMGNSIPSEFGFDDQEDADVKEITNAIKEWFLYSANRAEYNNGSWNFIEGETYLNRFPVNF